MKRQYQPIAIVFLFITTVSLLGVIFARHYEGEMIFASVFTEQEEAESMDEVVKNTESEEVVDDIDENTEMNDAINGIYDSMEIVGVGNASDIHKEQNNRPQFVTSDMSYFDDALFIGDSRVNGIFCYGTFENATFFAADGMSIYDLWRDKVSVEGYGKTYLKSLLSNRTYSKIYIMMGINELGEDHDVSARKYKEAVEQIQQMQPDAIIYVCANLHVTEKQSLSHKTFNNTNIDAFNEKLSRLADHEMIFYLDVNEVFNDENGNLIAEYSWDNIHLYGRYYDEWCEWFRQNTIVVKADKIEDIRK